MGRASVTPLVGAAAGVMLDGFYTSDEIYKPEVTNLNGSRQDLAAASVGDYALFGGGHMSSGYSAAVDAYNSTLVRTTPTALSVARSGLAAGAVGNYALIAGGYINGGGYSRNVDVYDGSLVHTTTYCSNGLNDGAAATVGDYALFGGNNNANITEYVDAYDRSLIHTTPVTMSAKKTSFAAASVGNYALFGGGFIAGPTAGVDAYSGGKSATFTIPAWSAYKFDGFHDTEQITFQDIPWSSHGALTGYIRRTFTLSGEHPEVP